MKQTAVSRQAARLRQREENIVERANNAIKRAKDRGRLSIILPSLRETMQEIGYTYNGKTFER